MNTVENNKYLLHVISIVIPVCNVHIDIGSYPPAFFVIADNMIMKPGLPNRLPFGLAQCIYDINKMIIFVTEYKRKYIVNKHLKPVN